MKNLYGTVWVILTEADRNALFSSCLTKPLYWFPPFPVDLDAFLIFYVEKKPEKKLNFKIVF